jgi:trk system potassium uptake protein
VLIRPDRRDLKIIGLNTGRVLLGLGLVLLVPAALALLWREYNEAAAFLIAACLPLLLGCAAEIRLRTRREAGWQHGMAVSALSWVLGPFFGAIPLYLSGHYGGFLDAYFDAMSGFATAGLAVINDLDHLASSVNLWRHLMQFLGGQGLVLIMLSFFAATSGAVGMYAGEGREDRILPNVARTARFIWRVALAWFAVGSLALWLVLSAAGMPLRDGAFHAVTLFMAAFDTGGFAPTSASLGMYHSGAVELVIAVLMVAGAMSFALHFHLWRRRFAELRANLEIRVLAISLVTLSVVTTVGLARTGAYDSTEALLRRGLFHLLSAHTGTGFATVPGPFFETYWGTLAPAAIVFAMGLGPMAGSTGGGIKAIRVGLIAKSMRQQLRRVSLPADAVTIESYHSGTRQVLRPRVAQAALLVLLLYLALYLLGALVGLHYGYTFQEAMFESTSAAAAVGLSVGLTGPGLETGMKVVFILQMWLGRLEFIAVFVLIGFAWSTVRGRR